MARTASSDSRQGTTLIGHHRVLMGSDYCFPIAYERPVEIVTANPHLSAEAKAAITASNARRLLKL